MHGKNRPQLWYVFDLNAKAKTDEDGKMYWLESTWKVAVYFPNSGGVHAKKTPFFMQDDQYCDTADERPGNPLLDGKFIPKA